MLHSALFDREPAEASEEDLQVRARAPGKRSLTASLPARRGGPPETAARVAAPIQASADGRAPFWFAGDAAPVQCKLEVGGGEAVGAAAGAAASGPGAALPDPLRDKMEASFATRFDDVRVFQGDHAEAIGARAFARGTELHFAPGAYDPHSEPGQQLIGHELAHVVQQRAGRVAGEQAYGGLINADPALEHEADVAGARAARGESALVAGGGAHAGGAIQRAIRIGANKAKPAFTTWKDFAASIPPPFAKLLAHEEAITKMLTDGAPEPHAFASYKALLDTLEGKVEDEPKLDLGSLCRQMGGFEASKALARAKILLCDGSHAPKDLAVFLDKGGFLVLCRDHVIDVPLLTLLGRWGKQIIAVDIDAMLFVCSWLQDRHGMPICLDAESVGGWLVDDEYVVPQSPQMRGDMHDVLPALALDRRLKVAMCVTMPSGFTDADIILGYYSGHKGRVVICPFGGGTLASLGGKCKKIGEATEVLVQAVQRDPTGARRTITEETTGSPTEEDNRLYLEVCLQLGFRPGVPYLIINYRDSGHNPGKDREASHPELDTGEVGLKQMMQAAIELGFVPVPMGQPPGMSRESKGPHLIEYWSLPCCRATDRRNKRQAEYGLLRFLAEHLNIRALAMRSGGTDAMVYAGIETISLDLASSGKSKEELDQANLGSKFQEGGNRSWMRAAVRDLIMPGKFHQGFFEHPRPDAPPPKAKATSSSKGESSKQAEEGPKPPWAGAFHSEDVRHIAQTIRFFFGTGENPLHGVLDLAPNCPLTNPQAFAEKLKVRRSPKDADAFLVYVREMEQARLLLYQALVRELELENQVLRLQIQLMELQLENIRLQAERLRLLLQLELQQTMLLLRGLDGQDDRGGTDPRGPETPPKDL
ncbi:MAG: DUF4157 domain-containing protein [Myxococcales bacterium]|nr:DUF4157 domain-containing protein [Myxococcales bacterium]